MLEFVQNNNKIKCKINLNFSSILLSFQLSFCSFNSNIIKAKESWQFVTLARIILFHTCFIFARIFSSYFEFMSNLITMICLFFYFKCAIWGKNLPFLSYFYISKQNLKFLFLLKM